MIINWQDNVAGFTGAHKYLIGGIIATGIIGVSIAVAVIPDCFIDEVNLVSDASAESVSLLAENADSVSLIIENIDVINAISTDSQDNVNSIAENVDSITELCRV